MAAGCLLVGGSLPLHAAAGEEPAPQDSAIECEFVAPHALLVADAYADYRFTPRPNNMTVETATLGKGVRLELRQSACVDSVDQEFIITVAKPAHAASDVKFWAQFASKVLLQMKTVPDAAGDVQPLRDFLAQAASIKPHQGQIVLCRNGTPAPDGECGWASGGEFLLEIKRAGADIVIDVAQGRSG